MTKKLTGILVLIATLHAAAAYSADVTSVSYLASNNVEIINPQHAYERLLSEPQDQLKNAMIDIMQSNAMEQSKCEDSIGIYRMEIDGNITSDNTKIFTTSPYQVISDSKAFEIAKQIVNTLKQESVAMFIPDEQASIGSVVVHLTSHQYNLNDTIQYINEKLPETYTNAFSLHLNNKQNGFDQTTVKSIEWLGNKIDPNTIQRGLSRRENNNKTWQSFSRI